MPVDVPANRTVVRTYDRLAGVYDRVVARVERPARRKAIALLDSSPGERVLDVGCGPGHAAVSIAERVASSGAAYGLDASGGMLSRASDHRSQSDSGERLGLVLGDARRLPFDGGTLDGVLLAQTLELFGADDRERALREIARVLAPDGRLVVTSMERGGPRRTRFVRAYEWLFAHTPYSRIGCRPIDVTATLAGPVSVSTVPRRFAWRASGPGPSLSHHRPIPADDARRRRGLVRPNRLATTLRSGRSSGAKTRRARRRGEARRGLPRAGSTVPSGCHGRQDLSSPTRYGESNS